MDGGPRRDCLPAEIETELRQRVNVLPFWSSPPAIASRCCQTVQVIRNCEHEIAADPTASVDRIVEVVRDMVEHL